MSGKLKRRASTLKRLLLLVLPYKGWIATSLICMMGFNIFTAAPPFYAKDIVDAIAYGDVPQLKQYFLVGFALVIVFVLKGFFFFGHVYFLGRLVQRLFLVLYSLQNR